MTALPFQNIGQIEAGLARIAITGTPRDRRLLAIQKVLYDLQSLFSVSTENTSGMFIRWNCAETGFFNLFRSHNVKMNARPGHCLAHCWNTLAAEARRHGAGYKTITADNCEGDKTILLGRFTEIQGKMLEFILKTGTE